MSYYNNDYNDYKLISFGGIGYTYSIRGINIAFLLEINGVEENGIFDISFKLPIILINNIIDITSLIDYINILINLKGLY